MVNQHGLHFQLQIAESYSHWLFIKYSGSKCLNSTLLHENCQFCRISQHPRPFHAFHQKEHNLSFMLLNSSFKNWCRYVMQQQQKKKKKKKMPRSPIYLMEGFYYNQVHMNIGRCPIWNRWVKDQKTGPFSRKTVFL